MRTETQFHNIDSSAPANAGVLEYAARASLATKRRNKMSNLQIVRRFKFSQFDTGWAVVDADGNVQAFFDDVEGEPDAALTAAQEWIA